MKALITGINGQLGSHLADLLLAKGYEVHGTVRPTADLSRLQHLDGKVRVHPILGPQAFRFILEREEPDEIYNLAAASSVSASWNAPVGTGDSAGLDVVRLLDAVKETCPKAKLYQASSSEMFGQVPGRMGKVCESSALHPRSPYAAAKAFAHHSVVCFRESFGLFAVSGICFNAEGPRRGAEFVTRKITRGVAAIKAGETDRLALGNLSARRDWGYAAEYAEAMWLMLQQNEPEDCIIATGAQHSVQDFCELAFAHAGMDWKDYVVVDPAFARPADVDSLVGDPSKILVKCGWKAKTGFKELVKMMVDAERNRPVTRPLS